MRLYHGTHRPFNRFDLRHQGTGVGYAEQGPGVYLTTGRKWARYFAREAAVNAEDPGNDGSVLEVELAPGTRLLDLDRHRLEPGRVIHWLLDNGIHPDTVRWLPHAEFVHPRRTLKAVERYLPRQGPNRELTAGFVYAMGYDGIIFDETGEIEGIECEADARTVVVYDPGLALVLEIPPEAAASQDLFDGEGDWPRPA